MAPRVPSLYSRQSSSLVVGQEQELWRRKPTTSPCVFTDCRSLSRVQPQTHAHHEQQRRHMRVLRYHRPSPAAALLFRMPAAEVLQRGLPAGGVAGRSQGRVQAAQGPRIFFLPGLLVFLIFCAGGGGGGGVYLAAREVAIPRPLARLRRPTRRRP